jgi:hypothetical protein
MKQIYFKHKMFFDESEEAGNKIINIFKAVKRVL